VIRLLPQGKENSIRQTPSAQQKQRQKSGQYKVKVNGFNLLVSHEWWVLLWHRCWPWLV